jgi:hypothetical protein
MPTGLAADGDPLAGVRAQGIDPRVDEAERTHDRELRAVYIARGVIRPASNES